MSAMWNSGRFPSSIATRVPRPTPSSANAAATRAARSPYSAYVSARYSAPSFQRSATASARASTVARNRPGTVWPATRSSSCARVTGPVIGLTVVPFPFRRAAELSTDLGGEPVGKGGKVRQPGGYCRAVRPEESVGAPGAATHVGASLRRISSGRTRASGSVLGDVLNSLAESADVPPMRPHARRPSVVAALFLAVLVIAGGLTTGSGGSEFGRAPPARRVHRRPTTTDPDTAEAYRALAIQVSRNNAMLAQLTTQLDATTQRLAELAAAIVDTQQKLDAARAESARLLQIVRDRAAYIYRNAHQPQVAVGDIAQHRGRHVGPEVRRGRDAHRRAADHRPQQAGRRARREAQGPREPARAAAGGARPAREREDRARRRSLHASRRCSTKRARSR